MSFKRPKIEPDAKDSEFRQLARNIVVLASEAGIEVRPYRNESLPIFSLKSPEEKLEILQWLRNNLTILGNTVSQAGQADLEKQSVWEAFKLYGLTPPADFFQYLSRGDVVEIHDFDGVQLFRNLQFFKYCSYTLEDLFCVPWPENYDHSQEMTDAILAVIEKIQNGFITNTQPTNIPEHYIYERFSERNYLIKAKVEYAAPLWDKNRRPAATVVIEKGQLVTDKPDRFK